jgi:hypothetical protein
MVNIVRGLAALGGALLALGGGMAQPTPPVHPPGLAPAWLALYSAQ